MNEYKFSDLAIGLKESFNVTIDSPKVDKFIDISADTNPLHVNCDYAKEKGFDGKIVHGLLTASFYSTLVGVYLPGKYCVLQGIDIQFSKPVHIDDRLVITGTISYINSAYKQIEIKATIINQNNIKVSKATIKVGVIDE